MSRLLSLALCVLVVSACDSGDESDLAAASFSLRVDGGETRTYTQAAYYGDQQVDGNQVFGILLGDENGSPSVALIRVGATPAEGSYRVGNALDIGGTGTTDVQAFYIDLSETDDPLSSPLAGFYFARSGSLTLDRVERGASVEGQFQLSVQAVRVDGFDPSDPDGGTPTVVPVGEPFPVSGAFNATFDADLFDDAGLPTDGAARVRLAVPPGLIRLPGMLR